MSCVENANELTLYPIIPGMIRDARYQSDTRVKLTPINIPPGTNFSSAPSYQTQGWTVSIHPEGKRYAHNKTDSGISVITEAPVSDPGVVGQLDECLALIQALAAEKDVCLPESTDLFLEFDSDTQTCNYWFADHAHRTVFWLHPVNTVEVALPNSYSNAHLQYTLEENYWAHVEMFPATASQYTMSALNELQIVLLHARADALTSDVPTFPYTAEECDRFIGLLQLGKEHSSNPFITTYVSRLWGVVANHRFFTHFGEHHCRMSSVHSVLEAPGIKRHFILTAISKALFGLPEGHRARLENLWVDDLVYTSAWRKYVSERIEDLKLKMLWLFALMIANILLLPIVHVPILNKSSTLLCILGLCITVVLFQEQGELDGTGSSTGAAYLDNRNTSYGFQPTAIVHSLPQASFTWASILFIIQGFWVTFGDLPPRIFLCTVIPVAVVLVVAFFGIWVALHPREKPFEEPTLPPSPLQTSPVDPKDVLAFGSVV